MRRTSPRTCLRLFMNAYVCEGPNEPNTFHGGAANYARREQGGPRVARRTNGAAGNSKRTTLKSCQPSRPGAKTENAAIAAGEFCPRLCQLEVRSVPAWRTRLLAPDSSISARMACKSSVAETTGKSMIKAQARASRHGQGPRSRFCVLRRHSQ